MNPASELLIQMESGGKPLPKSKLNLGKCIQLTCGQPQYAGSSSCKKHFKPTCKKCGEDVMGVKFCAKCGTAVPVRCPQCGVELGSAKFCAECGVAAEIKVVEPVATKPKSKPASDDAWSDDDDDSEHAKVAKFSSKVKTGDMDF